MIVEMTAHEKRLHLEWNQSATLVSADCLRKVVAFFGLSQNKRSEMTQHKLFRTPKGFKA